MNTAFAHEVLDFWFGAPGSVRHGKSRLEWFKKSDAFDALIHRRFYDIYEQAQNDALTHWRTSPLTLLAFIVVLDQFPRNMFRDTSRAFSGDAIALDGARHMINMGWDLRLNLVERQFAYLPFEHAEDLDAQRTSLHVFGSLDRPDLLEWARKHYIIIERFGRFPHRNVSVGRVSTSDEIDYLMQPGSGF
jgi:uncharacterized protein (DUF924 family)